MEEVKNEQTIGAGAEEKAKKHKKRQKIFLEVLKKYVQNRFNVLQYIR